jgi:hypothetical protein
MVVFAGAGRIIHGESGFLPGILAIFPVFR